MELRDCTNGKLVRRINSNTVGMIVGITNNRGFASEQERKSIDYAIPLVQWSYGDTSGVYAGNIEPL